MKIPHILNRIDSYIRPIEVALKNESFLRNLATLLKHYRNNLYQKKEHLQI